jgi:hypothetical protein
MMKSNSKIVWSLPWAFAIIGNAFLFRGNPLSDGIEAALIVGALAFVVLR